LRIGHVAESVEQLAKDRDGWAAMGSVLGANIDGSATAESSRGLLMTVFGEFVLPAGGAVWTQSLLAVLDQLGVKDKAARQAIARMRQRGWLGRKRVGRRTRWRLTPAAVNLLESGAERIYGFGRDEPEWDGQWVMVLASVPERDRHLRYRMGVGLNWAGFGTLGNGVWISPWADREADAHKLLEELGVVDPVIFRAELGSLGSGPGLVATAWDLPELRDQYQEFLSDFESLNGTEVRGELAAAQLTALVHRWRRFPFLDPDLPADLLPDDWPGAEAAERFHTLRHRLRPEAVAWWETNETDIGRQ
jgi:phenylacetic acid degradation operon negative regulatory protein